MEIVAAATPLTRVVSAEVAPKVWSASAVTARYLPPLSVISSAFLAAVVNILARVVASRAAGVNLATAISLSL